jgi:hypothetical protein
MMALPPLSLPLLRLPRPYIVVERLLRCVCGGPSSTAVCLWRFVCLLYQMYTIRISMYTRHMTAAHLRVWEDCGVVVDLFASWRSTTSSASPMGLRCFSEGEIVASTTAGRAIMLRLASPRVPASSSSPSSPARRSEPYQPTPLHRRPPHSCPPPLLGLRRPA